MPNNTKIVSGGIKKASRLKLGLLGLAAILVIGLGGYFGYSAYKVNSLKARAANWTVVDDIPDYGSLRMCKTQTIYGTYYQALFTRSFSSEKFTYKLGTRKYVMKNKVPNYSAKYYHQLSGDAWWGGTVAALGVLAPKTKFGLSWSGPTGSGELPDPGAYITDC